jgi:topoisomerase-4 subunit A
VEVKVTKGKAKTPDVEVVALADFLDIKGWKALGNRISLNDVVSIKPLDSDPEPEPEIAPDGGDDDPDDDDLLTDDPTSDDDGDMEDDATDSEEDVEADEEPEKPQPKQAAPKPVEKPAPVAKPVTPTPKPAEPTKSEPAKLEPEKDNSQPATNVILSGDEVDNSQLAPGSEVEWDVKKNTKTTKPPTDGGQQSLF